MRSPPSRDRRAHRYRLSAAALLAALFATAGLALAEVTLYRWTDADGTLTFSPTPPEDGTPYEKVDATGLPQVRATGPARVTTRSTPSPEPDTVPSVAPATGASAASTDGVAPSAAVPEAAAARASVTTRGTAAAAAARGATAVAAERAASGGEENGTVPIIASSDKARRCDELRKRIVSLESRLATALTPADMDNTVVHMARYQSSLERHCR